MEATNVQIEISLRDALLANAIYQDGNWESEGVIQTSSNTYEIDVDDDDLIEDFLEALNSKNIEII